jgi:hypothetical protein
MSHGVPYGVDVPRRLLGGRAGMHPDVREVLTEALLHDLAQRWC